jgi:hypothetical protein
LFSQRQQLEKELKEVSNTVDGILRYNKAKDIQTKITELSKEFEKVNADQKTKSLDFLISLSLPLGGDMHLKMVAKKAGGRETDDPIVIQICDLEMLCVGLIAEVIANKVQNVKTELMWNAQKQRIQLGQLAWEFEYKLLQCVGEKWAKTKLHPTTQKQLLVYNFHTLHEKYMDGNVTWSVKRKYQNQLAILFPGIDFETASVVLNDELRRMKDSRVDDAHPPLDFQILEPMLHKPEEVAILNYVKSH